MIEFQDGYNGFERSFEKGWGKREWTIGIILSVIAAVMFWKLAPIALAGFVLITN